MRGIESASEKDAGGGRASLETRAPRLARQKVFRRPRDPSVSVASHAPGPILVVSSASGRGRWLPRGLARGDGVGHAPLLERVRPVRSLLLGVLSARREGCAGGAGQCSTGERPENGQRVEKSGESVRGGTHLGPQRPPSGAHAENRDMLAMSVKLAGSGARVHVRRVSRARANARVRVMSQSPPNDIFGVMRAEKKPSSARTLLASGACFSNAPTLPRAWRQAWRQAWRPPPLPRTASPRTATSRSTWTG